MNLLLIDAGHAKNTPGKNNLKENFYEWQFNNSMQYKLKKRAEDHDVHVFLSNPTPEKTSDIPLTTRANKMNDYWKSKGKPKSLMISIHANAFSNSSARGTETFVAGNASQTSKDFAKDVNTEIFKTMKSLDSGAKDRGVKTENWTVIYKTNTPCCLIEYGFYSNLNDLKILKKNQDELVEATMKAICRYFKIAYKPVSNNNVTNETKPTLEQHKNCVLYGNDVDKVGAEIISWAKEDCIIKHIDKHIKWEGHNLFIVGGVAARKMKELNNGEQYKVVSGTDRYDTVRKCLELIGK